MRSAQARHQSQKKDINEQHYLMIIVGRLLYGGLGSTSREYRNMKRAVSTGFYVVICCCTELRTINPDGPRD